MDHEFARSTVFRRPIAHGLLVFSIGSGLAVACPPMRTFALLRFREWYFREPVFLGDTIRVHGRVVQKEVRGRGRRGEITWRRRIVNQESKVVQEGVVVTLVEGRGAERLGRGGQGGRGKTVMKEFQLLRPRQRPRGYFHRGFRRRIRLARLRAGSSRLVERAEQQSLLERFKDHDLRLVSGGSVANSVIAFSQLGGDAAFLGCVGDDRYGLFYQAEFEELGIDAGNMVLVGETTGTCACVITPDAERTMRVSAGLRRPVGGASRGRRSP